MSAHRLTGDKGTVPNQLATLFHTTVFACGLLETPSQTLASHRRRNAITSDDGRELSTTMDMGLSARGSRALCRGEYHSLETVGYV